MPEGTDNKPAIKAEQLERVYPNKLSSESRNFNPEETQDMKQQNQVAAAIKDLAARLQVGESDVAVAGIKEVTWRSGALGCPEPGNFYTQALVPGLQIVLTADGHSYQYHSTSDSKPFLCPKDRIESPVSDPNLSEI